MSKETFLPSLKNYDRVLSEDWLESALCKVVFEDRNWFSMGNIGKARAKEVCVECPVQFECLEYSIITGQRDGVWGGLDECERKDLIKDYQLHLEGAR